MARPDDLASILGPAVTVAPTGSMGGLALGGPPAGNDLGFSQGVILSYDILTGSNSVSVAGTELVDLPVLATTDTTNLLAGDVVALLRYKTSYFILGRIGVGQLLRNLVVPFGATAGQRIVLDGETGLITAYADSGAKIEIKPGAVYPEINLWSPDGTNRAFFNAYDVSGAANSGASLGINGGVFNAGANKWVMILEGDPDVSLNNNEAGFYLQDTATGLRSSSGGYLGMRRTTCFLVLASGGVDTGFQLFPGRTVHTGNLDVAFGNEVRVDGQFWNAATLNTNWQSLAGFPAVQFRMNAIDEIELTGLAQWTAVANSTSGATMFTLPVNYRPTNQQQFCCVRSGGLVGDVRVQTSGAVQLFSVLTTNQSVSLSGVRINLTA